MKYEDVEVDFSRFMNKINELEKNKKTRATLKSKENIDLSRVYIERYTEKAVNRIKIGNK